MLHFAKTPSGDEFTFEGNVWDGVRNIRAGSSNVGDISAETFARFFEEFKLGRKYLVNATRERRDVKPGTMGWFIYGPDCKGNCKTSYLAGILKYFHLIDCFQEGGKGYKFALLRSSVVACRIVPIRQSTNETVPVALAVA